MKYILMIITLNSFYNSIAEKITKTKPEDPQITAAAPDSLKFPLTPSLSSVADDSFLFEADVVGEAPEPPAEVVVPATLGCFTPAEAGKGLA